MDTSQANCKALTSVKEASTTRTLALTCVKEVIADLTCVKEAITDLTRVKEALIVRTLVKQTIKL